MVVRLVLIVFAAAFLVPLLVHWGKGRTPRPYFADMWSVQELDQAYSRAIAEAHPRREKRAPGPPLLVAGPTRECLKHLPEYTGCNHEDILEAARVCAGGDRSIRVHDNRGYFPIKVGRDPQGNHVSLVYDWDNARELAGRISFAYVGFVSEAQCPHEGQRKRRGSWGEYAGCYPDHGVNCEGAVSNHLKGPTPR